MPKKYVRKTPPKEGDSKLKKIMNYQLRACTNLGKNLSEMTEHIEENRQEIYTTAQVLNASLRTLLLMAEQEGKTQLSRAKIKKLDDSGDENPLEKVLQKLSDKK